MVKLFLLRRIINSQTSLAATYLKQNNHQYATVSNAVKHQLTENNKRSENERESWVILPPFTHTVNPNLLAEKISGKSEDKEGKTVNNNNDSALKWVVRNCPHLPRTLVHKLFRLRQVRRECLVEGVNDSDDGQQPRLKRVGEKDLMNEGERIFLPISVQGDRPPFKKTEYRCNDQDMHFTHSLVLYKDAEIIAINKPPKLPVQGGLGIKKSVDELAAAYLKYDNKDPPRLVHRLDQDSSGILVMGRTQTSAAVLHSIFREKTVGVLDDMEIDWKKRFLHKRYLALVFGVPKQSSGTVSVPLAKVVVGDGKSERITVADNKSSSQNAVTEYKVIQTSNYGYTWLELSPLTGRKHQLRVHCAEVLGTPIVGDYKYGWQAHRKWKPLLSPNSTENDKLKDAKSKHAGHDFNCGSISEKQPHLHLHCKQLTLPNISVALQNTSPDSNYDFSELPSLDLVAPLPFHMQRSWNFLNALAHQQPSP